MLKKGWKLPIQMVEPYGTMQKKQKTHKRETFIFSLWEVSINEFYFFLNVFKPHFYGIAPIRF